MISEHMMGKLPFQSVFSHIRIPRNRFTRTVAALLALAMIGGLAFLIERQTDNGHVYGVMVTNKNYECCMPGIFENRREAEKFIDLIMKNNVSPTHLSEIADDYMSSREIGA